MLNLGWWASLIVLVGLLKLLSPVTRVTRLLNALNARFEIAFGVTSTFLIKLFNRIELDLHIEGELSEQNWYYK